MDRQEGSIHEEYLEQTFQFESIERTAARGCHQEEKSLDELEGKLIEEELCTQDSEDQR